MEWRRLYDVNAQHAEVCHPLMFRNFLASLTMLSARQIKAKNGDRLSLTVITQPTRFSGKQARLECALLFDPCHRCSLAILSTYFACVHL